MEVIASFFEHLVLPHDISFTFIRICSIVVSGDLFQIQMRVSDIQNESTCYTCHINKDNLSVIALGINPVMTH